MNNDIERQFQAFISAGNEVIGRPKKISGNFTLQFGTSKGSKIIFGDNCVISHIAINIEQGNATLSFGNSTSIRGRYFIGSTSKIHIGDGTAINRHVLLVATECASINIGDGCLLSDVSMSTTDWHSIMDANTKERINPAKDIVIEEKVWIGEGVSIQKGVFIGKDSVVGAKSVVTKSIPPGSLAVGIPARVIRSNIIWQRDLIPMQYLPAMPYE